MLFHVLDAAAWAALAPGEEIVAATPFLHLCTAAQLPGVLERYYAGRTDLVVLTIDESKLGSELRWEGGIDPRTGQGTTGPEASGGTEERFPHLYGPLRRVAVLDARALPDGDGARGRSPRDRLS